MTYKEKSCVGCKYFEEGNPLINHFCGWCRLPIWTKGHKTTKDIWNKKKHKFEKINVIKKGVIVRIKGECIKKKEVGL